MNSKGSTAVSWWDVHTFIAPVLARIGPCPMVGTPEWCDLPDDDRRKIGAIFDAAQHWALRLETCQQAQCEASRALSAAADWPAIAQEIWQRTNFHTARPWLRREVA